jgi:riboflavin synthase
MFTGIIEEVGRVVSVVPTSGGASLRVAATRVLEGTKDGDSIATDGCCLTVVRRTKTGFEADCSAETLRRTSIGTWKPGTLVNLERALAFGARLGGHLVQGHVEGVGALVEKRPEGDSVVMRFSFPPDLARYIVMKGSVAIAGISLTVAALGDDWLEVAVIPTTLRETTLGAMPAGAPVNFETDMLAKYVERLLGFDAPQAPRKPTLSVESLKAMGY